MANEQSGTPLRRWRSSFGAFVAIDDAIEAAGHPRAAFRDVRVGILQLLRAATDDGAAEQLCAALDDAMVESLKTLRVTPIPHAALVSTDLAKCVGALGNHGDARIRGLASDVVRGWRTANGDATATAVKEVGKPSGDPIPCHDISTAVKKPVIAQSKKIEEAKKLVAAQSKKLEAKKPIITQREKMDIKKPIAAQSEKVVEAKKLIVSQNDKMETTKRKLHEGYEEAKKMKRQHTIQKIDDKDAAKMFERSQPKMHRGPARCLRTSSGVRRSLLPSLQLV